MGYSDKDLLVATQIAYYDFNLQVLRDNNYSASLREIFKQDKTVLDNIKAAIEKAKAKGSALELSRAESAMELYNEIISEDSKYGDWIIKGVRDENKENGFYGCLIETSPDSAIIGFRGSESKDATQVKNDWVNADFALLNSTLTEQQGVAEKFMAEINEKYNYDNYATSGHSLGGNLSAHATITAPDELKSKITQSLNFDGPGFSDEYLAEYADRISQVSGIMTHYQWSVVGALLNQVPGENYQSIKTNDKVYGSYELGALVQKHDTSFVAFDENGKALPGEIDNFARTFGELSRQIDSCPSWMGNSLIWGISSIMTMSPTEKKIAAGALITGLAAYAITHPVTTVVGLVALGTLAVIGWINPEFFGETLIPFICGAVSTAIDFGKAVVNGITSAVKEVLLGAKMAANLVSTIVDGVSNVIKGFVSWAKDIFSSGGNYARYNPNIKVDLYKLRMFAERLNAINRRIAYIDRRLDSLYMQVGLDDLLSLIKADVMTGYSWRLNQCINYLNSAANELEDTEWKLVRQAGV